MKSKKNCHSEREMCHSELVSESHWQMKTLGEVCEFSRGLTYSKKDEVPFSNTVVLRSNNVNLLTYELDFTELKYISDDIVVSDEKRLQKNSLLICIANGSKNHLGKVALIEDEKNFAFGGFMGKITPNSIIVPKFLYYSMLTDSYKKFIAKLSDGTNINNLKFIDLKDYQIPLPPLEEQKRIVEILDKKFLQIQNLLNAAQKSLQDVKELKQSIISEKLKVDSEELKVKNGWQIKTLGEVCEKKLNKKWKEENAESEYYYIDLSSVDREANCITETQLINKENAPSRAQQIVKDGDILFGTTRPTLKRVCIVPEEYDNQICSTGFCVLRPNQKIIKADWIFYQLQDENFYKYIEPLQKGANYPAVTDKEVLNYSIHLPPLAEQERIVKTLDAQTSKLKELEQNYTEQIALYQELKQSLLQQAFSGELSR